jgi:hypothetical protein
MGLAYALELGELVGDFEERVSSGFGKGEEEKRKKTKKPQFFSRSKKTTYKKTLGYYLQSVPSLIFFDVKRKDFGELLAHHVATIGLVVYSLHVK